LRDASCFYALIICELEDAAVAVIELAADLSVLIVAALIAAAKAGAATAATSAAVFDEWDGSVSIVPTCVTARVVCRHRFWLAGTDAGTLDASAQIITWKRNGFCIDGKEGFSGYLDCSRRLCNQTACENDIAGTAACIGDDDRIQEGCICQEGETDNRCDAACGTRQTNIRNREGAGAGNVYGNAVPGGHNQFEFAAAATAEDAAMDDNRDLSNPGPCFPDQQHGFRRSASFQTGAVGDGLE